MRNHSVIKFCLFYSNLCYVSTHDDLQIQDLEQEKATLTNELTVARADATDTKQQLAEVEAIQTQLLDGVRDAREESAHIRTQLEETHKVRQQLEDASKQLKGQIYLLRYISPSPTLTLSLSLCFSLIL